MDCVCVCEFVMLKLNHSERLCITYGSQTTDWVSNVMLRIPFFGHERTSHQISLRTHRHTWGLSVCFPSRILRRTAVISEEQIVICLAKAFDFSFSKRKTFTLLCIHVFWWCVIKGDSWFDGKMTKPDLFKILIISQMLTSPALPDFLSFRRINIVSDCAQICHKVCNQKSEISIRFQTFLFFFKLSTIPF